MNGRGHVDHESSQSVCSRSVLLSQGRCCDCSSTIIVYPAPPWEDPGTVVEAGRAGHSSGQDWSGAAIDGAIEGVGNQTVPFIALTARVILPTAGVEGGLIVLCVCVWVGVWVGVCVCR